MYTEMLMGALVAFAAPQDPQVRIDTRDIDHRAVEIEIPAIEIPEFDIYIPGFEISVPVAEGHWNSEVHWDSYALGVAIGVPDVWVTVPYDHDDWSDWDDHRQDMDLDTTFAVDPNGMLGIRNHAGEIIIRTWNRDEVRVEANFSSYDRVKIFESGSGVRIKSETRHGLPEEVDYELTIPRTMAVDLWGFETDIWVDGAQNGVHAETLEGDIEIADCAGEITLHSVDGDINVTGSAGRLEVTGMDGELTVIGFDGGIFAESIDGEIMLEDVNSADVEAKTVDGDVYYDGTIADNGRYKLTTHDGDVVVTVVGNVNATISVATFDGGFEADFPIELSGAQASRKFTFTIGDGSARIEMHSFDGDIRLLQR
jgi:DUF4097 and DUF4098 domain-containing protein YvlB